MIHRVLGVENFLPQKKSHGRWVSLYFFPGFSLSPNHRHMDVTNYNRVKARLYLCRTISLMFNLSFHQTSIVAGRSLFCKHLTFKSFQEHLIVQRKEQRLNAITCATSDSEGLDISARAILIITSRFKEFQD